MAVKRWTWRTGKGSREIKVKSSTEMDAMGSIRIRIQDFPQGSMKQKYQSRCKGVKVSTGMSINWSTEIKIDHSVRTMIQGNKDKGCVQTDTQGSVYGNAIRIIEMGSMETMLIFFPFFPPLLTDANRIS